MTGFNLDDWLGPNAFSFMPIDPAAPYFPADDSDRQQTPSSIVADRLARKGLTASPPKSAASDEGIDDWIFPTADGAAPYLPASAKDQQQPPSSAAADRLRRKGLTERPPKTAALDDGPDDWIVPSVQTATAGSPAATSGSDVFHRLLPSDGAPDDWIYPQASAPDSMTGVFVPTMQRAWEGARQGFGSEPLGFSQENIRKYPQTYLTWQPLAAPLDAAARLPGAAIGAGAGLVGGAYQALGGNEAESRRLERDLNMFGQAGLLAPGLAPAFIPRGPMGGLRRDGTPGRLNVAEPIPQTAPTLTPSPSVEPRYTVSARSPSLSGTEIDVSGELFDGLRLKPGRFYANYESLSRKHPEYLKDAEAAKLHVEQVLSNPEIAIPQRSGNLDLVSRSSNGDKLIGFKAELKNNRYNISTAYILTAGQLERMKEGAVRAGATVLELNSRDH